MNNILRAMLILTFIVCLISIYGGGGCCVGKALLARGGHSDKESSKNVEVVKDPVCGMEVNDLKKSLSAVYKGKEYYFCSEYCKKTFKNDPASYTPVATQQHDEGGGHKYSDKHFSKRAPTRRCASVGCAPE
jgi:YHS domain-containing protein